MRAKFNALPRETQKLADNVTMFDGPGGAVVVLNFAKPGTFDAIVRLSTPPGDLLPDSVSSPRAWAIKVIGTPEAAAMLPGHEQHHTQDFLCQTGKAFGVADAGAFLQADAILREARYGLRDTEGSSLDCCKPRGVGN
jgi:hypothetical protein